MALYHSVKLLLEKKFDSQEISNFELQLDSTDDFAIYVGQSAISVHQVKAKASPYRSTFEEALAKSSKINFDCSPATKRYFHIANKIDDDSDYKSPGGENVEFYSYGSDRFCSLDSIESTTKIKIKDYLTLNKLPVSEFLLDAKYCYLSELISRQVVKIHSQVHGGKTQNSAAYLEVIQSSALEEILKRDFSGVIDVPYRLAKLRALFADAFENYVSQSEFFTLEQLDNFGEIFRFVHSMDDSSLEELMASLRPAHDDQLRADDITLYADTVTSISAEIVLKGLPHYSSSSNLYLPTSLMATDKGAARFKDRLLAYLSTNDRLTSILFEYNILISANDEHAEINISCADGKITKMDIDNRNNIVRKMPISVISRNAAREKLDA